MAIRYFKTKNGRMLASLPTGEMIEGIYASFLIKPTSVFFFNNHNLND